MKVIFVYSGIVVDDVNGIYYHNFLNAIIERYGNLGDLTICVAKNECECSKQNKLDLKDKNINLIFVNKENTFKTRFISKKYNKNILKKALINKDLLIVHAPDSVGYTASLIAKKMKIPYLSVAIGCSFDSLWNHSLKGKLLAPLSFIQMKREMKYAKYAIYVTNNFLQKRYPTMGKSLGCSDVVMPLIHPNEIKERIERIRNTNLCHLKAATVAAVNIAYKGQQDVIRCIQGLNELGIKIDYYLIGGGNNTLLKDLVNKHKIENQVHFIGLLPHNEVQNFLKNMDLYIQPSRTEGLSRAILEAMNVGLPCIVTNVGGNLELINSNYTYKPGDLKCLIKLIKELTPQVLESMAVENLTKVKDFDENLLNKKRSDFFKMIKDELKTIKKINDL